VTRAAFALPAVLAALGCGNLDRDVIVARPELDGEVSAEAGAPAPPEEDAAPAPRRAAPDECPWDGGCQPVRCAPHECSRYCPYGCGDPFPTSPATDPRSTYHPRPRMGAL
jgi:hypothetical protein